MTSVKTRSIDAVFPMVQDDAPDVWATPALTSTQWLILVALRVEDRPLTAIEIIRGIGRITERHARALIQPPIYQAIKALRKSGHIVVASDKPTTTKRGTPRATDRGTKYLARANQIDLSDYANHARAMCNLWDKITSNGLIVDAHGPSAVRRRDSELPSNDTELTAGAADKRHRQFVASRMEEASDEQSSSAPDKGRRDRRITRVSLPE